MDKEQIKKIIKEKNIRYIRLQFVDMLGIPKNFSISVDLLDSVFESGMGFDSSSIKGFTDVSCSDSVLMPDPNTFGVVPWLDEARIICDVCYPTTLKPFEGDSRSLLKSEIQKLAEEKMEFYVGPEIEFHLLKEENGKLIPHDTGGFADFAPLDLGEEIRNKAGLYMQTMGVRSEITHHEVGFGQHEIDFRYSDALRTADNVITFKLVTKTIALKYGLHATFMPKPVYGINGSGMHTHLSLFKGDENIFYDKNGKYELSNEALYFIGGILKHAKGICFIANPLINFYKRIVPGYEAPVYISWALRNRSALIRVPAATGKYRRIEFRSPDPSCNPYLAFSVILTAGIDGIRNNIDPGEPTNIDIYNLTDDERKKRGIDSLPGSLMEAKEEFLKDKVLIDSLSEHIIEKFIEAKNEEWDSFRTHITNWELDRFLEIY